MCSAICIFQTIISVLVILSDVLYGCETWSLTLREERRLRVFENSVLRRIFGPKRDEEPVPVAARSKAWVCGRSLAEIMGSNPAGGMDVCLL